MVQNKKKERHGAGLALKDTGSRQGRQNTQAQQGMVVAHYLRITSAKILLRHAGEEEGGEEEKEEEHEYSRRVSGPAPGPARESPNNRQKAASGAGAGKTNSSSTTEAIGRRSLSLL